MAEESSRVELDASVLERLLAWGHLGRGVGVASDAKKLMQRIIELESGKTFPPGKDKEKKIVKRFVKYVSHIEWTPFDENGPFPNNGELVLVAWIGRHSPLFDSRKIAEAQFRYYPDDDMKMFVVANDKSFVADEEVCPTHWARPLTHLPLFGPERN